MAGFREFAAGEPLTATNVDDFLMKQSVMKFADGAARDAALGTAVVSPNALREGMVAYLDDTDEVIKYDGSAWAAVGAAGIGSNVVQTVKTNTFSTSSTSFVTVTGMTVTITPSAASSRILLILDTNMSLNGSVSHAQMRIVGGNADDYVGDAAGSRIRSVTTWYNATTTGTAGWNQTFLAARQGAVYVDSPNTTSPVTYTLEARTSANTLYVNRAAVDADSTLYGRIPSSFTAIEVAA